PPAPLATHPSGATVLLTVENLDVSFPTGDGVLHAVRDVSFELDAGETVVIVGESGSGKSVSTQAMVGLARGAEVSGRAVFEGRDLLTMSPAELRGVRGARIGMVFQDPLSSLHPQYRVGWQIAEALRAHGVPAGEARKRVVELLGEVGIPAPERRADDYPHQFSGGMRQRVMMALALALRPALLVADEPTTALDVTVQAQLLQLLEDLQREHGTAIIMITHDLGVVTEVADRVLTMYGGRIVERGTRDELFARPHHPYTRGLLASVPRGGQRSAALVPIPGQPPSLLVDRPVCSFAPRCAHPMPECLEQRPPEQHVAGTQSSACLLPASHAGPVVLPPAVHASTTEPARGATPLARLTDVTVHFPGPRKGILGRVADPVRAVDGVSLEVHEGETLGIVGESGCGKSTLARVLTGLIPPTGGSVEIGGRSMAELSAAERRAIRQDVQLIFQDPYGALNPQRRVGSIIADPLVIHGRKDGVRSRVQELMELVGLNPEHYNRFPAEFSGGQRQRIGIARALALNPRLVVCDEPVSALDVSIQAQILNLLAELQRELGLTYVFIAHDLAVVEHVADRLAVMYLGKVVETGPTERVYADPRHPYTRALLDAAPTLELDETRAGGRVLLQGDVPSPIAPPAGCRFHPRCPVAQPDCSDEVPALVPKAGDGPERAAACIHPLTRVEALR
ncbi:ABC transporter ATP-binding protein, partial [Blastococcus sp. MG754426]|uniref:dipeptide ABC transporter ATP-binding protein n=1 Tax=Blastococcus sp. MG754426 TaxID=2570317 RepID=UPI001F45EDC1